MGAKYVSCSVDQNVSSEKRQLIWMTENNILEGQGITEILIVHIFHIYVHIFHIYVHTHTLSRTLTQEN